jgi:hypothetical protein
MTFLGKSENPSCEGFRTNQLLYPKEGSALAEAGSCKVFSVETRVCAQVSPFEHCGQ